MTNTSLLIERAGDGDEFDVVVIGAGFCGLNALYRLRKHGLRVRAFEAGGDVGGTWYWNRYPGARVDAESLEYSYAFSEELQQEWRWPARYSEQSDVLKYLEWVSNRLDLRRDIDFNTRIAAAELDPTADLWTLTTEEGRTVRCRYCVMAVGFLSAAYWPDLSGLSTFTGDLVHTGAWPQDGLELVGRTVGIIGTGATTVQLLPAIAPLSDHVKVFQRTPNWCLPITNMTMPDDYEAYVKSIYPELRRYEYGCNGPGPVLVDFRIRPPSKTSALDVTPEEREREYEARWSDCGLHVGTSFRDLLTNKSANDTLRIFLERKIRSIVRDPEIADLLIPEHPPLTRRPCGESGYYEMFNRDNVSLVDVLKDPIEEIVPTGLRLEGGDEHDLDVIICATGFDAGTGSLTRMGITGRDGRSLTSEWKNTVRSHLGLMVHGYPNFFMLNAVQSPSALFLPPLLGDYQMDCVLRIIDECRRRDVLAVEPREQAQLAWVDQVEAAVNRTLIPMANSWWMGANIPGKPRQMLAYVGGFPRYKDYAEAALSGGFQDYVFGPSTGDSGGMKVSSE